MSFVAKGVKRLFKNVKRAFRNKWVRAAVGVGLTLFAVGAFQGGWGDAWRTATADGGGTIGNFFQAVGKTISTGFGRVVAGAQSVWGKMTGKGQPGDVLPEPTGEGSDPHLPNVDVPGNTGDAFSSLFRSSGGLNSLGWAAIKGGFAMWQASEEEKASKEWYYEQLGHRNIWGMGAYGDEASGTSVIRNPFGRSEGKPSYANNFAETYETEPDG
jgi:hypothetical protein